VKNKLKEKLKAGKQVVGFCPYLDNLQVTSAIADMDAYDYVLIDTQHGNVAVEALRRMIIGVGKNHDIIVRVVFNEPFLINQALDMGADGVIVPLTNTADDVRRAVQAAKYPPKGFRSWGPHGLAKYGGAEAYANTANDEVIVWPQIESKEAVENIDAILKVEGVDGIMIGPADLGLTYGFKPHEGNEQRDKIIQHVMDRCIANKVPWGMFSATIEQTEKWFAKGGKIGTVGSDLGIILGGMADTNKKVAAMKARLNK